MIHSQDQHGSRFIQQRLELADDAEKQTIFGEVLLEGNVMQCGVMYNVM